MVLSRVCVGHAVASIFRDGLAETLNVSFQNSNRIV